MTNARNAVVLLYHRLSDEPRDLFKLSVGTEAFAAQVRMIRKIAEIVPLREIFEGDGPRVAITFDDGYASGFVGDQVEALSGLPVTVFLVSGSMGAEGFWWDELEQIMLDTVEFPASIEINIAGRDLWVGTATPSGRERAGQAIQDRLAGMPLAHIERHIDDLRVLLGASNGSDTPRRVMTEDEVRELAAQPNIEIGAHTLSHAPLDVLSADDQRREIEGSRTRLAAIAKSVTSFAYPYGRLGEETEAIVKQAGFQRACAITPGPVRRGTNPYLIPRYSVENWSAEEFSDRLSSWLREE